jgi:tartrate-resistant acid phosphatase type 5
MPRPPIRFEPFLHLAGLTADRALVAWGGFYFGRHGDTWRLLDDDELPPERPRGARTGTIGAGSAPYGRAVVEVTREGRTVARAETSDRSWAWVDGLQPGAEHHYRVMVDGREWAGGELWDWDLDRGTPAPSGRRYDNRFRTLPPPDSRAPVDFAVIGDFGVGITTAAEASRRQLRLAEALERAVDDRGVTLVLTAGDNVRCSATAGAR